MTPAQKITSDLFFDHLVDAGIFPADDGKYVRRVVIDAQAGHAIIVHVERFGDERLLNVVRTLEGVEVARG